MRFLAALRGLSVVFSSLALAAGGAHAQSAGVLPSKAIYLIPKVIYGNDDRIDVYQETSLERMRQAFSTCALVDPSDLVNNGDGTYSMLTNVWSEVTGLLACASEPFGTQRVAAYCSGFLVGPDIVVTAGHCPVTGDYFVFGFDMVGPNQEISKFDASQVYSMQSILAQAEDDSDPNNVLDYQVVKLDRPVTAFGAAPMNLRRAGTIPIGTNVGVIGHPAGLPKKIAFGPTTQVYLNANSGYFTANTDTYAGNSGSPIFNAVSNTLEGILVRGAIDYKAASGGCFISNTVTDASAANVNGEEISKALLFDSFVPVRTTPFFNQVSYRNGQLVAIMLTDTNAGTTVSVQLTTTRGDSERVVLSDPDGDKVYRGLLPISSNPATVTTSNSLLEGFTSDTITAIYRDANGEGATGPNTVSSTAPLDNTGPVLSNLQLLALGDTWATYQFQTSEWASCRVQYGNTINNPTNEMFTNADSRGLFHIITFSDLHPCDTQFFRIVATDAAGNSTLADNNGFEYLLHTQTSLGLSEAFDFPLTNWTHSSVVGGDHWAERGTVNAPSGTNVISYEPGDVNPSFGTDASLVSPLLPTGALLEFYQNYGFEKGSGNFDGGVLEYSTDNGTTWTDVNTAGRFIEGGYNGTLSTIYSNPLGGRQAWTGTTESAFVRCRVNLSGLTNVKIRFRYGADISGQSVGWQIDNLSVGGFAACPNAAADWPIYK